ncbi:hypothetical protein [Azospirillum sp. B4]|uniref:hypothetical protein n=1 Tax=Azospirillum sp. B4 TaxID=95605 RepID=UPI00034D37BB|nr:hypothetical protein [Azospirillum sp. B4]
MMATVMGTRAPAAGKDWSTVLPRWLGWLGWDGGHHVGDTVTAREFGTWLGAGVLLALLVGNAVPVSDAVSAGRGVGVRMDDVLIRLDRHAQMLELLRRNLCAADQARGGSICPGVQAQALSTPLTAYVPKGAPLEALFALRSVKSGPVPTAWVSRTGDALGAGLQEIRVGTVVPGLGRVEQLVQTPNGWVLQTSAGYLSLDTAAGEQSPGGQGTSGQGTSGQGTSGQGTSAGQEGNGA